MSPNRCAQLQILFASYFMKYDDIFTTKHDPLIQE